MRTGMRRTTHGVALWSSHKASFTTSCRGTNSRLFSNNSRCSMEYGEAANIRKKMLPLSHPRVFEMEIPLPSFPRASERAVASKKTNTRRGTSERSSDSLPTRRNLNLGCGTCRSRLFGTNLTPSQLGKETSYIDFCTNGKKIYANNCINFYRVFLHTALLYKRNKYLNNI